MRSFIKICLICTIGINRPKEKFHRKTRNMLNYSLPSPFFLFLAWWEVGITGHNFGRGPSHQSLAAIGPVVSEEKIKMWNVDGRLTKSDDNSSHGLKARWAKKLSRTKNRALTFVEPEKNRTHIWFRLVLLFIKRFLHKFLPRSMLYQVPCCGSY